MVIEASCFAENFELEGVENMTVGVPISEMADIERVFNLMVDELFYKIVEIDYLVKMSYHYGTPILLHFNCMFFTSLFHYYNL